MQTETVINNQESMKVSSKEIKLIPIFLSLLRKIMGLKYLDRRAQLMKHSVNKKTRNNNNKMIVLIMAMTMMLIIDRVMRIMKLSSLIL